MRDGNRVGSRHEGRHATVGSRRFWGEAAAYLDLCFAHDVSCSRAHPHVDLRVGGRWALGVGRRHRQRSGSGGPGWQRGHGRWNDSARGGGGSRHGATSGSRGPAAALAGPDRGWSRATIGRGIPHNNKMIASTFFFFFGCQTGRNRACGESNFGIYFCQLPLSRNLSS